MFAMLYNLYKYVLKQEHYRTESVFVFYVLIGINIIARVAGLVVFILMALNPLNILLTLTFRWLILISVFSVSCIGIQISRNMAELTIYYKILQGIYSEEMALKYKRTFKYFSWFCYALITITIGVAVGFTYKNRTTNLMLFKAFTGITIQFGIVCLYSFITVILLSFFVWMKRSIYQFNQLVVQPNDGEK